MIVKVCGLTQPENIQALTALPIDLFGFVFYPASPRYVDPEQGLEAWLRAEGQQLEQERVGVFVNALIPDVLAAVEAYELDYVQLHGSESPGYCSELQAFLGVTVRSETQLIKSFPVDAGFDFSTTLQYVPFCRYFLFDTKTPAHGGSGKKYDWSLLDGYEGNTPFLLSGGIGPDDAAAVNAFNHPKCVGIDLNSRFETEPGVKDVAQLRAFLSEERRNE